MDTQMLETPQTTIRFGCGRCNVMRKLTLDKANLGTFAYYVYLCRTLSRRKFGLVGEGGYGTTQSSGRALHRWNFDPSQLHGATSCKFREGVQSRRR